MNNFSVLIRHLNIFYSPFLQVQLLVDVEKLNVWEAYNQAKENSKDYEPIVVMKKNNQKALVVLDAEKFVEICQKLNLSK